MDEAHPDYDDLLEFNPNIWTRQVAFRESFKTCWRAAGTAATRSACIAPELAYQQDIVQRSSNALRALLSDDDWRTLQEELEHFPSADGGTCVTDTDPSKSNADGAEFCRVYRTALLANHLRVQLALQTDSDKD